MPKTRLTEIAQEYEVDFKEALETATLKLPPEHISGKGRNTWITEKGKHLLDRSMLIDIITPKHFSGKVLSECNNKRYNYIYSKEIGKKVPVLVPKKLRGKMVGKRVTFEKIESISGSGYRYVG